MLPACRLPCRFPKSGRDAQANDHRRRATASPVPLVRERHTAEPGQGLLDHPYQTLGLT